MNAALSARNMVRTFREARQRRSILAQVREYRHFISMSIETDDFLLRTIEHPSDLLKVLQLRHEVFIEEWQGRKAYHRLDVDGFDFQADHLVIIDKKSKEFVGTYRLLCSRFTSDFYSRSEFDVQRFLDVPGTKLELGRACIKASHRNGATIDMLWRGLAKYIQLSHSRFLFGCSSVKSMNAEFLSNMYFDFASQDQWSSEFDINPTEDYRFPRFAMSQGRPLSVQERREAVPPLLRTYFQAGAKVYGAPALDREFECTDLFTILDLSQLSDRFRARYF